jgi:hypothetical protein
MHDTIFIGLGVAPRHQARSVTSEAIWSLLS